MSRNEHHNSSFNSLSSALSFHGQTSATPSCTAWQNLPYVPSSTSKVAALVINLRKSSHIILLLCAQTSTMADRICKNSIQAIISVLHWKFSTPRSIKFHNFSFHFQDQQTIQTHLDKCNSSSVGTDLLSSTYLYSSTLTLMIALKTGSNAEPRV